MPCERPRGTRQQVRCRIAAHINRTRASSADSKVTEQTRKGLFITP